MDRLRALSLVLLLVLAGCSGADSPATTSPLTSSPTTEADATTGLTSPETTEVNPPTTDEATARGSTTVTELRDPVPVVGGSVPVSPEREFERVENLTGTDVALPERIIFRNPSDRNTAELTAFQRYLGFDPVGSSLHAYVNSSNVVVVNESLEDRPTEVESILAHEYYHVIQQRGDAFDEAWTGVGERPLDGGGYDGSYVRWAVMEGAADFVQERYWRTHVEEGESPLARMERDYRESAPTRKLSRGRYYFGYRYVDARVDSPRNLSTVYETVPRTTEQLIHARPNGSEPPVDLDVRASGGSGWLVNDRNRMGELFVRHALDVGLDTSAARTGADGWGNDRRVEFWNSSTEALGYVWVVRWDDSANASEFETAFGRNLDEWATRDGARWVTENATVETNRVDDDTVAVTVGPRSFVEAASVEKSDESIVVIPNG